MLLMPSIAKSEIRLIRTRFRMCRFPSLSIPAMNMRKRHREDTEFRAFMVAHNRRIAKTKKYSPEKYQKMIMVGKRTCQLPALIEGRKKKRNYKRKKSIKFTEELNRPNDYAGVITLSDYESL